MSQPFFFVPFILRNCNNLFCIWYLVCWNGRSALSNQEVVARKPLAEFLRHEILEPLQLTETFFQVPLDRQDDLAALYKREPWHGSSSLSGIEMIDFCGFFPFFGYILRFDRHSSNYILWSFVEKMANMDGLDAESESIKEPRNMLLSHAFHKYSLF